jgi:hypothetical protein
VTKNNWRERFEDITALKHLARNGTVILKFYLNVSKEEQRLRFLDRLEQPAKNWKCSMTTSPGVPVGTDTRACTRILFSTPRRRSRHGTGYPPTTNGSRGW